MPVDEMKLSVNQLSQLTDGALQKLGLTDSEISIVKDVLLYAELRGKSQGLIKIAEKSILPAEDRTEMTIDTRTPCISYINGNGNIGMVVLSRAAEIAIENCKTHGLAVVGTCGTSSSTGSIGYYAEKIAAAGFVGMVMAGSPKVMALHGSVKPALGTNPVAFGIPTSTQPLVFDMATSAITWFEIISKKHAGEPIPSDVAVDCNGKTTTSAEAALQGALRAFGGAKGSGLALMVECLTGPLMGAAIVGDEKDNRGNFVLAINPTLLSGPSFYSRMDGFVAKLRGTSEQGDLRLPGDAGRVIPDKVSIPMSLFNALNSI